MRVEYWDSGILGSRIQVTRDATRDSGDWHLRSSSSSGASPQTGSMEGRELGNQESESQASGSIEERDLNGATEGEKFRGFVSCASAVESDAKNAARDLKI